MSEDQTTDRQFRPPASDWVRDQLAEIERTGDTRSVDIQGRPVVVLTMKGAKSGLWRKVPLMRVEHEGSYAAVASAGGAEKHPAWYHNISAHHDIELQDATTTGAYRARELADGPERDAWWERCVAAFPPYAEYQTKTDRLIPVLVCEPV